MKAKIIHAKTGLLRMAAALLLLTATISLKAENHWTPDTTPYEDYMTITGYIVRNGVELASSQYEVGCFIDGECRASYRLAEVSYPGHTHPCFLSIWGSASDNGKAITLRVYDHDSGETWPVDQKPVYQYGESIGVEAPVRLTVVSSAPTYTVTIMTIGNGTVTSDKQDVFEAETVTLTIQPAEKHELESIVAYKSGSASVTVPLTGAGNSRTFVMPAYDVTVSATFRKTQATLDEEVVAAAKVVIENTTFSLTQQQGNTETEVAQWLAEELNGLLDDMGIYVTTADIAITAFTPAVAGTESDQDGVSGSFSFTVTLTKGACTDVTASLAGVIVATPYDVGVNDGEITTLRVSVVSNGLLVRGLTQGTILSVFNIQGYLISERQAAGDQQTVILPTHGLYIVIHAGQRIKVVY